jgi:hypothetical protein
MAAIFILPLITVCLQVRGPHDYKQVAQVLSWWKLATHTSFRAPLVLICNSWAHWTSDFE